MGFALAARWASVLTVHVARCLDDAMVASWLSGNALVSVNVVSIRQARLVSGWVTALGRVNHIGAEPGTRVYTAWAIPRWVCAMNTQRKLGESTGTSRDTLARIHGLDVWAGVWLRVS